MHISILLTDLHTFSYSISWENLLKDQSNFPLVFILLILVTSSLGYVLILCGKIGGSSPLGFKRKGPQCFFLVSKLETGLVALVPCCVPRAYLEKIRIPQLSEQLNSSRNAKRDGTSKRDDQGWGGGVRMRFPQDGS